MKFEDWPEVLTPNDVMDCLKAGHVEVYMWFKQKDFPLLRPGKRHNMQVGKYAFHDWLNKRTIK